MQFINQEKENNSNKLLIKRKNKKAENQKLSIEYSNFWFLNHV